MTHIPAPQPALLRVLHRHKSILVLLPMLFALLSGLAVWIIPERYEAFGLVQIMPQNEFLGLKEYNPPIILNDSVVLSQVEIIRSPSLLNHVAAKLKLSRTALQKAIDVRPLGRSYIIRISANVPDPELAKEIVNHVILAYQENQIGGKITFAGQQAVWLKKHLSHLSEKARQSAQKVEAYRTQKGLFANDQGDVIDQQIAALSNQLVQAQAEQADIDSQPANINDKVIAAQLASPVMHDLSQEELLLREKLGALRQKYGARHPQLLATQAELSALSTKRSQEIERIKTSIKEEKNQSAEKVKNILAQLEDLKQQQQSENSTSIPLHELEQEAKINIILYENVLRQSQEIDLVDGLPQADSRIVSLADKPLVPSRPSTLLIMLLGAAAGFLIASFSVILGEQLSQAIDRPETILQAYPSMALHMVDFTDPDPTDLRYHGFLLKQKLPLPRHIMIDYLCEADRHHAKLFASFLNTQLQKYESSVAVSSQFLQGQPDQTNQARHYLIVREGFTSLYDLHVAMDQCDHITGVIYLWT
ncbi:MAG TPA: GumC family protein [Alphaproteobacteria bacterium]